MSRNILQKSLCLLLTLLLVGLLATCGEHQPVGTTEPETTESETTEPVPETTQTPIPDGPEATFEVLGEMPMKVIYADKLSDTVINRAIELTKTITGMSYTYMYYGSDWEDDPANVVHGDREILIGNTNRQASAELISSLEQDSFGIRVTENQIVIAGTDEVCTYYALKYFTETVLTGPTVKADKGTLMIPPVDYTQKVEKETLKQLLDRGASVIAVPELVVELDVVKGFFSSQGACYDGKYAYITRIRIGGDESACCVSKYDPADGWKEIKRSEPMPMGHANDITYYNGELYVTVYDGGEVMGVMNAETLELVRTVELKDFSASGIHYYPEKDQFILQAGSTMTGITDTQFNLIDTLMPANNDRTTQGVCCDENFVYHQLWDELDRKTVHDGMLIYDWTGKLVANCDIYMDNTAVIKESKSLFMMDGQLYTMFLNWVTGDSIYKVHFVEE